MLNSTRSIMGVFVLLIFSCGFLAMLVSAPDELLWLGRVVVYTVVLAVVSAILGTLGYLGVMYRQNYLEKRENRLQQEAERKAVENDARLTVVRGQRGEQIYGIDWEAGTPMVHAIHQELRNSFPLGSWGEPSDHELLAGQIYADNFGHRAGRNGDIQVVEDRPDHLLPHPKTRNLIQLLATMQVVIIVGIRDAGKTTLMQHIQKARMVQGSQVLAYDPHTKPGKYLPGVEVVTVKYKEGQDLTNPEQWKAADYTPIMKALNNEIGLMNFRYFEINQGICDEREHPHRTMFLDEWRAILKRLGGSKGEAAQAIRLILAESRKTNTDVVLASPSDRAEPLGLSGEYDLAEGVVFVYLKHDPISDDRHAIVKYGDQEERFELPGPYIADKPVQVESEQQTARRMFYGEGKTISAIAIKLKGDKGTPQNNAVRKLLGLPDDKSLDKVNRQPKAFWPVMWPESGV